MRLSGKIVKWNDEKGFGFIKQNSGAEIFVHIKAFEKRYRSPGVNDIVTFELGTDAKGRARAKSVKFEDQKIALTIPTRLSLAYFFAACGFLIFIGYWAFVGKIPVLLVALYILASLFSFFLYALDKSAARGGYWRTQESTLHLFSFFGGWPGALVAQIILRHKTKKQSFRKVFWASVLINCCALGWLLSPYGSGSLLALNSSAVNHHVDKYLRLLTTGHRLPRG